MRSVRHSKQLVRQYSPRAHVRTVAYGRDAVRFVVVSGGGPRGIALSDAQPTPDLAWIDAATTIDDLRSGKRHQPDPLVS